MTTMKTNRVASLKENDKVEEGVDTANRNDVQLARRKKLEWIYSRHQKNFRSQLENSSLTEEQIAQMENTKCTRFLNCLHSNFVKSSEYVRKGVRKANDVMSKLGFYSASASFHYFDYSLALVAWATFLIATLNFVDARLIFRLFGEDFPLILVGVSSVQTLFCVCILITGIFSIKIRRSFYILNTHLIVVILTVFVVVMNLAARNYFSQKSVIEGYLNSHIANYHKNHKRNLSDFMIRVQQEFDCCGSKGPRDYILHESDHTNYLPLSCCFFNYSVLRPKDKEVCYFLKSPSNLKSRRDVVMYSVLNPKGCGDKIVKFMENRNEFETMFTVLLIVIFALIIPCTLWYRFLMKIVDRKETIREKLHHCTKAKRLWRVVRSRLLGGESLDTHAINILRKGIHKCTNKYEIRQFLSKCTDAKHLLRERNPINLAQDILTDNTITALGNSLAEVNVTQSEQMEYNEKLMGSASVTDLAVDEHQNKAVEITRARIQNYLEKDYWMEENAPKKRKVNKINPENIDPSEKPFLEIPNIQDTLIPFVGHEHLHRKSIIQLQLKNHLLKEQRLKLAKIIGAFQQEQLTIEDRRIQYSLDHPNIPIPEIFKMNMDQDSDELSDIHEEVSNKTIDVNKNLTRILLGPTLGLVDKIPRIELVDSSTSTALPQVKNLPRKAESRIPTALSRQNTWTYEAEPQPETETNEIGTNVHTEDLLKEGIAFGTQTTKTRQKKKK